MTIEKIFSPSDVNELIHDLNIVKKSFNYLAGGTDFFVHLREKPFDSTTLIDLSKIKEIKYISEDEKHIFIGSMVTFSEMENHALINKHAACLRESAANTGSKQIRNTGTIGGNIANKAPAAGSACALLSLQAEILLYSAKGNNAWTDLNSYLKSDLPTEYLENAFIHSVRFMKNSERKSAFAKIGSRSTVTISQLILAWSIDEIQDDLIFRSNISIGSAGNHAVMAYNSMNQIEGKKLTKKLYPKLCKCLQTELFSLIGTRESFSYKNEAICGLVDNVLSKLIMNGADAQ